METDRIDRWRRWRGRRRILADFGARTHPHQQHALLVEWLLKVPYVLIFPIVVIRPVCTTYATRAVIASSYWVTNVPMNIAHAAGIVSSKRLLSSVVQLCEAACIPVKIKLLELLKLLRCRSFR